MEGRDGANAFNFVDVAAGLGERLPEKRLRRPVAAARGESGEPGCFFFTTPAIGKGHRVDSGFQHGTLQALGFRGYLFA